MFLYRSCRGLSLDNEQIFYGFRATSFLIFWAKQHWSDEYLSLGRVLTPLATPFLSGIESGSATLDNEEATSDMDLALKMDNDDIKVEPNTEQ